MSNLKHLLLLILGLSVVFFAGCSTNSDNTSVGPSTSDVTVLTGTITDNTTLTADNNYLLRGGVFVGDDDNETVLTIEPGTVIYGESATWGMLVIRRGSKIMAEGTVDAPIVFTSDKPVGQRGRANWGGLIINGRAPLNTGPEAYGEGGTGYYGGDDPDDNSGVLRYVRVEFAGREISPDNELNGIAFQGVGSGTTVEYIQVHMNKDDGIEFFGGTVNTKYLYVTGCADDQFDWTDGWQGKGQFWVCQQYGDDADQGIEADNNADNNDATPRSNPTIYNITLIGDKGGVESDIGVLLREGTGATIRNAIVMNFGDCGIDLDHEATFQNAWGGTALNGNLIVDNCIFYDNTETWQTSDDDETTFPFTTQEFIGTLNANNQFSDPNLTAPYDKANPDFRPGSGSIALSGYAQPPADGFFESVDFIGGVDPDNNWLEGWTTSAQD